jgi:splicing factor 3B subunit 3
LDIGPIPQGRQRCNFLSVGLSDHTCRILDLSPDKDDPLSELSSQKFESSIQSVAII